MGIHPTMMANVKILEAIGTSLIQETTESMGLMCERLDGHFGIAAEPTIIKLSSTQKIATGGPKDTSKMEIPTASNLERMAPDCKLVILWHCITRHTTNSFICNKARRNQKQALQCRPTNGTMQKNGTMQNGTLQSLRLSKLSMLAKSGCGTREKAKRADSYECLMAGFWTRVGAMMTPCLMAGFWTRVGAMMTPCLMGGHGSTGKLLRQMVESHCGTLNTSASCACLMLDTWIRAIATSMVHGKNSVLLSFNQEQKAQAALGKSNCMSMGTSMDLRVVSPRETTIV